MRYVVTKNDKGEVTLTLGLSHYATFEPGASPEDVIMGVNMLVEKVTDISAFEMAQAVAKELGLTDEVQQEN